MDGLLVGWLAWQAGRLAGWLFFGSFLFGF